VALPIVVTGDEQSLELVAPSRKKRNVDRPETRAKVPRSGPGSWPNLRDHRLTVDREALRILVNLQRARGWAYITDAGLRVAFCEDTGHMPGVGTMYAALERMRALGLLHVVWLLKGGLRPDGEPATAGMWLIRVALNRGERQSFFGRYKRAREKTTGRINHRAVFELMTSKRAAAPAPPASTLGPSDFERRRDEQLARLRALAPELEAPS
jgi:hypothetical protein